MFLYPNQSIGWARIYGPYVDTLFKYGYIDWKYRDARGSYFSTIQLTDIGRAIHMRLQQLEPTRR